MLTVAKWGIAGALILPQSVLLGMTFPLMSAGVLRLQRGQPGRTLSLLYFANSLGAAVGRSGRGVLSGAAGRASRARCWPRRCSTWWSRLVTIGVIVAQLRRRRGASGCRPPRSNVSARSATTGARRSDAPAPAALHQLRHRGRLVHLRDRLDPDAGPGARQRHPLLRADAVRLHSGSCAGRLVDSLPGRPPARPAADARRGAVDHGLLALATLPLYICSFGWIASLLATFARTDAGYTGFTLARYGLCLVIMLPATFCAGMTLPLITRTLLGRLGRAGDRLRSTPGTHWARSWA